MANRKFFAGDTVMLTHSRYRSHYHHTARVTGTRITRYLSGDKLSLVSYRIACECGKALLPMALHMDLVTADATAAPNIENLRFQYFLSKVGLHSDPATLRQQVDAALGILNEQHRNIIVQRFGLGGEPGQTFRAIADDLGVSKQYIHQTEMKALRKLRSFPGLVKEPA